MRSTQRRWKTPLVVAAALTAGLATPAGAALPTGVLSRVSEAGGTEAALDDTGTVVAYLSGASGHVMVGSTRVVADAGARELAISADGSTVAFSTDRALAGGDTNGTRDVYAVRRDGSGLRLVSSGAPNTAAFSPSVNLDGSVIAYSAGGISAGSKREIFVRSGGAAAEKVPAPAGRPCDCFSPSISNDGNRIAFEVTENGVHVWNRGGSVVAVEILGGASHPSMAGSGRAVAYQAGNSIYVQDLGTGERNTAPEDGSNPSLSADGLVVAFQATRALTSDSNNKDDIAVFDVRDRQSKACAGGPCVARVSTRPDGRTATGGSFLPSINADGSRVAFQSDAADLLAGDGNGVADVFLRLPGDNAPPPVVPGIGPDGTTIIDDPDIPGAYWLVASDGGIFSFAGLGTEARFFGSTGDIRLAQPIVGMTNHPGGKGYWFVAADGGIFSFGDSGFFGSMGGKPLAKPIVGMASTPSGQGYWLVASDGGIFTFGDAGFFGSTGAIKLAKPIVGMASTPSGKGYWLVASDGGIFAFGDAAFYGSTGAISLNKPIVGMATRPQGDGYWLVASDGGIFSFGAAPFKGSTGAIKLNQPIVGMANTSTGNGYWFVASDGGIFNYGDAGFFGSMGATRLNKPIVGMAGIN